MGFFPGLGLVCSQWRATLSLAGLVPDESRTISLLSPGSPGWPRASFVLVAQVALKVSRTESERTLKPPFSGLVSPLFHSPVSQDEFQHQVPEMECLAS